MKLVQIILLVSFIFTSLTLFAQNKPTGVLSGTVKDKNTQELLVGVAVQLEGIEPPIGAVTDIEGRFKIVNIPTGSYNVKASFVGYTPQTLFNIVITSGNANIVNFELAAATGVLNEVVISNDRSRSASPVTIETPLSIQRLTTEEIRSNPGGNFDISRVVQSLPGVGINSVGGFRNDIIIRGGAPNENVYYLDGVEVPIINHFSTQGSAGGPAGILNVSFIEDVSLSSSAFNAKYDNALSSVLQFKQRDGNRDNIQGNVRMSSTELATTLEGPLSKSKNTTFLASARRSYLQYLFQAIDLPIRPNFWDFQYKITHKLSNKTTLTALGLGAIDEFSFGVPRKTTPEKEYIIRSQPSINQWNYTTGFTLKHLIDKGYINVALSRNMLDNQLDRFEDKQIGDESRRLLKVRSQEIENKLRIDVNRFEGDWKYSYGLVGQYVKYNNSTFSRVRREIRDENGAVIQPGLSFDFNTAIDFFRYGAFAQLSRNLLNNRLSLSAGLRTDMNSFTTDGNNPLKGLSPRVSASYAITDQWSINASVGRYAKIPIYTVLGYRDNNGNLSNRNSEYTTCDHYVTGLEFVPRASTRITVEGFYKMYDKYPIGLRNGVSLANQGGDFGVIGSEPVNAIGKGRSYGMEVFLQQKLIKDVFAVFSYTLFRSEFSNADGKYVVSAWDSRHLISALFGKKFKRGWELGVKYRFAGGAPYTPFDAVASQRNYASLGTGILAYDQLNSDRLGIFQQLDVRVDKKWNFRGLTLDVYLDILNVLSNPNPAYPQYTFERTADNSGFKTTDGNALKADGSNAIPLILNNNDASLLPSLGFIVEF